MLILLYKGSTPLKFSSKQWRGFFPRLRSITCPFLCERKELFTLATSARNISLEGLRRRRKNLKPWLIRSSLKKEEEGGGWLDWSSSALAKSLLGRDIAPIIKVLLDRNFPRWLPFEERRDSGKWSSEIGQLLPYI